MKELWKHVSEDMTVYYGDCLRHWFARVSIIGTEYQFELSTQREKGTK